MKNKNLYDLKKRLVMAFVSIFTVLGLIIYSDYGIMPWFVCLVIMSLASIALSEYSHFCRYQGIVLSKKNLMIFSSLYIFSSYFSTLYILPDITLTVISAAFIFVSFLSHFGSSVNAIKDVACSIFAFFYITVPLSFLLQILFLKEEAAFINYFDQDGRFWIVYLLLITKVTDAGAYFVGRLFGKRSLAINISPNKTWEGAVGGIVIAILTSILFSLWASYYADFYFEMNLLTSAILGLFLGVLGQLGDLAESLLKRDADVKDSNKIPGLGGVLDMIDSLLFTAPVIYIFLRI
ncbi:MAG: phosphatidate cytidylyltransferase [Rhabdochlamydiaceae bacterium]